MNEYDKRKRTLYSKEETIERAEAIIEYLLTFNEYPQGIFRKRGNDSRMNTLSNIQNIDDFKKEVENTLKGQLHDLVGVLKGLFQDLINEYQTQLITRTDIELLSDEGISEEIRQLIVSQTHPLFRKFCRLAKQINNQHEAAVKTNERVEDNGMSFENLSISIAPSIVNLSPEEMKKTNTLLIKPFEVGAALPDTFQTNLESQMLARTIATITVIVERLQNKGTTKSKAKAQNILSEFKALLENNQEPSAALKAIKGAVRNKNSQLGQALHAHRSRFMKWRKTASEKMMDKAIDEIEAEQGMSRPGKLT